LSWGSGRRRCQSTGSPLLHHQKDVHSGPALSGVPGARSSHKPACNSHNPARAPSPRPPPAHSRTGGSGAAVTRWSALTCTGSPSLLASSPRPVSSSLLQVGTNLGVTIGVSRGEPRPRMARTLAMASARDSPVLPSLAGGPWRPPTRICPGSSCPCRPCPPGRAARPPCTPPPAPAWTWCGWWRSSRRWSSRRTGCSARTDCRPVWPSQGRRGRPR